MRSEEVGDFAAFVKQIEIFGLLSDLVIFRGQPVSGRLLPAIARPNPSKNTESLEKKLLEQLSLMGAALIAAPQPSSLDVMVLAQHFGLKTRLLDWTSNPLAALWFACAHPDPGDVYIYALEAHDLQVQGVYGQDPFAQKKTRVFQPRLNNPRIIAQHGWFTLHRYSRQAGKFIALEFNADIKGRLTEYKVAEQNRIDILRSLDRHGISRHTLFPDLEGLCKHLNWKHGLPQD
jgi:hypothetical protein